MLAGDYKKPRDDFADFDALREQIKTLSTKVNVIGEKLGFTPTSKISAAAKARLEEAFKKFQDYSSSSIRRTKTKSAPFLPSADFHYELSLYAAFFFALISLRLIRTSAIWIALSAAPLRRLSDTHHSTRPFSTVASSRMRLI